MKLSELFTQQDSTFLHTTLSEDDWIMASRKPHLLLIIKEIKIKSRLSSAVSRPGVSQPLLPDSNPTVNLRASCWCIAKHYRLTF